MEHTWRKPRRVDGGEPCTAWGPSSTTVPSLRPSVPELALFRGCQDRAHPLSREVGRCRSGSRPDAQHHLSMRRPRAGHAVHDEVLLPHFFGSGIVVSIPKKKWEQITYDDLKPVRSCARATPAPSILAGKFTRTARIIRRAPGSCRRRASGSSSRRSEGGGHDTLANDHPLATRRPQRRPAAPAPRRRIQEVVGRRTEATISNGSRCTASCSRTAFWASRISRDIDKVTGRRCTFAFFPWNWERGDGCIVRLVAMRWDPKGALPDREGEKF